MRRRRRRRRRRKWLLRIVLKLTPERATTTLKTTTVRKQKAKHCENTKVYGTLIMKCPNCFWHDYYKICPICDHQIPEERNYIRGLSRLWSNYSQKSEDVSNQFLFPL